MGFPSALGARLGKIEAQETSTQDLMDSEPSS